MSRADATLSVALMRVPTLYNRDAGDKLHLLANTMRRLGWWPIPNASQPRSVLHLDNLARAIVLTLRSGASGVQFAADPEPMVLPMLADACEMSGNGRVRLVRLPEVAFSPLRLAARDLFRSLYGRSLIASELCLRDDSLPFRSTRDGLLDLFPSSPQDTRNGRS